MAWFKIYIILLVVLIMISTASGLPEILNGFNSVYSTSNTKLDTCDLCHTAIKSKPKDKIKELKLNPYGKKIKDNLNMDVYQAFTTIENLDSDKDGFTNKEEIHNMTLPGDKEDTPDINQKSNIFGFLRKYFEILFF